MNRLWDKGLPLDQRVLRYTAGEDPVLDARLVPYDVRASTAHAEMLAARALIDAADCQRIGEGLAALEASFARGEWQIELEDEDVHTALETRLTELIGAAGERLHLGRSRNDQVLTALRLYLRDAAHDLAQRTGTLVQALAALSERQGSVVLPGYTHMQHAMPSSVALWSGGFREAFADAIAGFEAADRRAALNPLGSAAGYGTGLPLDRDRTTAALGFAATQEPVTAAQLSRGRAESTLLFEITLLLQDLGRLASDLLLFYTQEFSYIALPASHTTGSSIMPQKHNPDVLELARAASATALACLNESLGITAKLPSGYHRDLQRLKAPLFRGIDLCVETVAVMADLIGSLEFLPDNIRLDDGVYAAERAFKLVQTEGITFREAYRRVAGRYAK